MKNCIVIGILLIFNIGIAQHTIFDTVELDDLETVDLKKTSLSDIDIAFDKAKLLKKDTLSTNDNELRGDIIISLLANELGSRINSQTVNPRDKKVKNLLLKFEGEKYFIHQPKISDFLKLMKYSCDGNYTYIYSRFATSGFYFPTIIISALFLLFIILNFLGKIKWKYKKQFNTFLIVSIGIVILLIIIFKLTCTQYVQPDSFYGISF
ncbi:hypothetical protein [uncultured Kordia sp.]|uniref:hypothetical protein n=1 Tax=uncultured Kordia sp. TaxID=507699 RepID=UPI0026055F0F|nr:hypothetical protein [uncultured Kordia sp.]